MKRILRSLVPQGGDSDVGVQRRGIVLAGDDGCHYGARYVESGEVLWGTARLVGGRLPDHLGGGRPAVHRGPPALVARSGAGCPAWEERARSYREDWRIGRARPINRIGAPVPALSTGVSESAPVHAGGARGRWAGSGLEGRSRIRSAVGAVRSRLEVEFSRQKWSLVYNCRWRWPSHGTLAEGAGFEPAGGGVSTATRSSAGRLQPLGHPSSLVGAGGLINPRPFLSIAL